MRLKSEDTAEPDTTAQRRYEGAFSQRRPIPGVADLKSLAERMKTLTSTVLATIAFLAGTAILLWYGYWSGEIGYAPSDLRVSIVASLHCAVVVSLVADFCAQVLRKSRFVIYPVSVAFGFVTSFLASIILFTMVGKDSLLQSLDAYTSPIFKAWAAGAVFSFVVAAELRKKWANQSAETTAVKCPPSSPDSRSAVSHL